METVWQLRLAIITVLSNCCIGYCDIAMPCFYLTGPKRGALLYGSDLYGPERFAKEFGARQVALILRAPFYRVSLRG